MATLIERARELRAIIVKAAQSLDNDIAVKAPELYDEWKPGVSYIAGEKLRRNNRVCQVQENQGHTSQVGWEPENTPSLFKFIDEAHTGTVDDPIPYDSNMELFEGLYYIHADVLYRCTRNTEIPVYHPLKDLVGIYVEVA